MYDEPTFAPSGQPGPDAAGEAFAFPGWEIIHSYSREQALADGELVDVTTAARQAGIRLPAAVTRAAYHRCVGGGHEEPFVRQLKAALKVAADRYRAMFTFSHDREGELFEVPLVAVLGPGDRGEPVLTVMLPGED